MHIKECKQSRIKKSKTFYSVRNVYKQSGNSEKSAKIPKKQSGATSIDGKQVDSILRAW